MRFVSTFALASAVAGIVILRSAGRFLVIDMPQHADAIVVLAGDRNDSRYRRGLELLKAGYAPEMLVDANEDLVLFGRTAADQAKEFVGRSDKSLASRIMVCPIRGDSTDEETTAVSRCLKRTRAASILLVTSDFHTRRALSVFEARLPQFTWAIAAVRDPAWFGETFWRRREWAKTTLLEWTKLLWWNLIDRWRRRHENGMIKSEFV